MKKEMENEEQIKEQKKQQQKDKEKQEKHQEKEMKEKKARQEQKGEEQQDWTTPKSARNMLRRVPITLPRCTVQAGAAAEAATWLHSSCKWISPQQVKDARGALSRVSS